MFWGQARGLQLQHFVWGADPRTALRRLLGLAESAHGALSFHFGYLYGGQTLGLQIGLCGHRPHFRFLFSLPVGEMCQLSPVSGRSHLIGGACP